MRSTITPPYYINSGFLTSYYSIATGTLVDSAMIVDHSGQSVWGKSANIEVHRCRIMKRCCSFVRIANLRSANSWLPNNGTPSLSPSMTRAMLKRKVFISEANDTFSTRSRRSKIFHSCSPNRFVVLYFHIFCVPHPDLAMADMKLCLYIGQGGDCRGKVQSIHSHYALSWDRYWWWSYQFHFQTSTVPHSEQSLN
jgi:hypothetical protein